MISEINLSDVGALPARNNDGGKQYE